MRADRFAALPARPAAVAEWEELLVRLELAPRAVRTTLEEAGAADALPEGGGAPGVAGHLAHLAHRERQAAGWLQALAEGAELAPWADAVPDVEAGRSAAVHLARFAELRARNFGRVQRRGLEVWEWRAAHPPHGEVSAFQLLSYLARHDGRHLAAIREALRAAGRC